MSAEREKALRIVVEAGPEAGKEYRFNQRSITLGRSSFNDVILAQDKTISEYHARLVYEPGGWVIQDLSSKNGVYLERNGVFQRVRVSSPLVLGRTVRLGVTHLSLRDLDIERAGRPAPNAPGEATPPVRSPEAPQTGTPAARQREPQHDEQESMVLRIDHESDVLRFQLFSAGAYGARHGVPFCSEDVREVNGRLGSLVTLANRHRDHMTGEVRAQVEHALADVGAFIGGHLFPKRIRKRLAARQGDDLFLIHDSSLVRVPWELALLEGEYLCRRFNVGRQIMVDDYSSVQLEEEEERPLRMLIISNPTGDLPDVQEEAEALFDHLESVEDQVEVDFLAGSRVERLDLLRRLSNTDIVFYVGHAEHDVQNPSNSAWLLERGRITCGDFRRLQPAPRLVFANGCETGKEASWSPETSKASHGYGIASGFILGGVQSYVGALWPIPADSATDFAVAFFSQLFAGAPVGTSLRRAREHIVTTFGLPEILWASYVLYGHPGSRIL